MTFLSFLESIEDFLPLIIFCSIILFLCFLFVGLMIYEDTQEVKLFNKTHNTNYTFKEWFFGEELIKDYINGKEININVREK